MTRLLHRLTSIPLAARVLMLAALITGILTVAAVAREPGSSNPGETDGDELVEALGGTPGALSGDSRGGGGIPTEEQLKEGAIPPPPDNVQAPPEDTRHANNSRFSMPLEHWTAVTDRFGAPRGGGLIHGGIDLALDDYPHSPVFSACAGTVIEAEYSNTYGYHVIVDCGDGYTTLYAHFSEIRVSVGQQVSPNNVLGISGSTGFSTGEHLHFEIRWRGVHVNPEDYLDFHIAPGTPLSSGPIIWGSTTMGGGRGSGGAGTGAEGDNGNDPTGTAGTDPTAGNSPSATATATAIPPTATPTLTPTPTNTPTPTPTPLPPTPTRTPTPRPVLH
ncbi:MAG: M23 family metallopeptidase [Hyphomicrobiales bacterium]